MTSRRLIWVSALLFLLALAVVGLVRFQAQPLVPRDAAWTVTGPFSKGGVWPRTEFDRQMSSRQRALDFWGSWSGDKSAVGTLRSPVFPAPAVLECFLSGYLGKPGLTLALERQSDHFQAPLEIPGHQFPAETWRRFYWQIPAALRGQPVSLVATDSGHSRWWFGVSTPRRFSPLELFHQELPSNLLFLLRFILNFVLFVLPGFAFASLLVTRWPAARHYALIFILAADGVAGYASFYLFLSSRPLGKLFVFTIYLAALAQLVHLFWTKRNIRALLCETTEPLVLTALTALCYLCFTYAFINPLTTGATYIDGRFFVEQKPGDNLIPMFFAERVYDRTPLRPFCCGGWLSSDRPPLQTGLFLLERPLPLPRNVDINYQLLATALQCVWICGVWVLMTALGASLVQIRSALALLIFSGCMFYNSVYTWPKFLAATFVLFAVAIVVELIRAKRVAGYARIGLGATCLGLALVSHPGSLFSLAGLLLLVVRFWNLFPVRKMALVLPILLAFGLPWTAYQKFVDPPGNRLTKLHLAGVGEIDGRTAGQAIHDAYALRSFRQLAELRWANVKGLAGYKPFDIFGRHDQPADSPMKPTEWMRWMQIQYVWNGLGVLNLGWIAGLLFLIKRRHREELMAYAGWIILLVGVNMLIWCLLEFGPGWAIIPHFSFADFLFLSVALLLLILRLPRIVFMIALALQLTNFFVVWVWSPPYRFASWGGDNNIVSLQWPLLLFGCLLSVTLLVLCGAVLPRRKIPSGPWLRSGNAESLHLPVKMAALQPE